MFNLVSGCRLCAGTLPGSVDTLCRPPSPDTTEGSLWPAILPIIATTQNRSFQVLDECACRGDRHVDLSVFGISYHLINAGGFLTEGAAQWGKGTHSSHDLMGFESQ